MRTDQMVAALRELRSENSALRTRVASLEAFKAYVHRRLDEAGIPAHPNGPHSKEGCRVGDRLDLLAACREREGTLSLELCALKESLARRDDLERFMSKVQVADGCWVWNGLSGDRSYGSFWLDGRTMRATHAALLLLRGIEVPPGLFACHKCDNPPCVNPDHLFVGDHAANGQDMAAKGRDAATRYPNDIPRGERVGSAKLKEADIPEIRRLAAEGRSYAEIGRKFGVDRTLISGIVRGKYWSHVRAALADTGGTGR